MSGLSSIDATTAKVPLAYTNKPATLTVSAPVTITATTVSDSADQTCWARWTAERPSHPRNTPLWWRDQLVVIAVFAITGSSTLYFVRPLISHVFGVTGSLVDGPWSYRLLCLLVIMPAYSAMLVTIGTLAGRHAYFKRIAMRTWGRLLPKRLLNGSATTSSTAATAAKKQS